MNFHESVPTWLEDARFVKHLEDELKRRGITYDDAATFQGLCAARAAIRKTKEERKQRGSNQNNTK